MPLLITTHTQNRVITTFENFSWSPIHLPNRYLACSIELRDLKFFAPNMIYYSRVYISWNKAFFKILKKPSIVQKKNTSYGKPLVFSLIEKMSIFQLHQFSIALYFSDFLKGTKVFPLIFLFFSKIRF